MLMVDSLLDEVRTELGGLGVDIELEKSDLIHCVRKTLRLLSRHLPQELYEGMVINRSIHRYKIDKPNILDVTECFFMAQQQFSNVVNNSESHVNRYLTLMEMEERQRVFDDFPEWRTQREVDPADGLTYLYLYLHFTNESYMDPYGNLPYAIGYRYTFSLDVSNDALIGLPRIPHDMEQWVTDYTVACAREILGEKRNKYTGIVGPDGGVMQTDGGEQINRAREDKRSLEEDLLSQHRQMPIIID